MIKRVGRLLVSNCSRDKVPKIYILSINNFRLPILSDKRPIRILPASPNKDPAPINPVQRSLIWIYLLALERAVPEIPKAKPQAI